jgi:Predicted secreted protein containing a PDZ domain
MRSTFRFLRVRGIAIGAHWSWLVVAVLVAWSLAAVVFPTAYPGLGGDAYLVMGVVAAALFFGSVLLHELGHALVALREGMELDEITLWLLGGVAHLRGRPRSPGVEFRVAIAGPLVTLLLACVCYGVALTGRIAGWPPQVIAVAEYLALLNVVVLVFNLMPALPLDGGRVLRAFLWHRKGGFPRATRLSAAAGRGFGLALVAVGLLGFFTGGGVGALWLVLLGWFLSQAAQTEDQDALARQSLRGLTVGEVMRPDPVTVPPDITVDRFLDIAAGARFSTFPVTEDGEPRGLVSIRQAAAVPAGERGRRTVADVMTPADRVPVAAPGDEVADTLDAMRDDVHRLLVVEGGRITGILTGSDVAHALEVRLARGLPPEHVRGRRRGVLLGAGLAVLVLFAAGLLLYRPPLVVLTPGPTFDVAGDITIRGRAVTPVNGRYLATGVNIGQPNALGAIIAGIRPDQEVLRASSVLPQGVPAEQYLERQRRAYEESRLVAAAAGARAAGLDVPISGTGVQVTGVLPDAPAYGVLRPGDVIVAVDGRPVGHIWRLQEIVSARPAGTVFTLTVDRQGVSVRERVASADLPRLDQGTGLGIAGQTRNLRVELPFEVSFRERPQAAGPSAGLAYATAVADLLATEDYARGRTIAATGTIRLDGAVGEVGGVTQKAFTAARAGASVFVVPAEELGEARPGGPGLSVRGVETLRQTLTLLSGRA